MARIRSIKPETWDDEVLGACSVLARLTFYGLISYADDEGRGRSGARFLLSRLHAHSPDVTLDDMGAAMAELARTDRVVFYTVNGEKYYWLRNFNKHQVIKKPTRSSMPSPPVPNGFPTSSPPVTPGTEGNGEERRGVERSGAGAERSGTDRRGEASTGSATAAPATPQDADENPEPVIPMTEIAAELGIDLELTAPPARFLTPEEHARRKARLRDQAKTIAPIPDATKTEEP